TSQMRQASTQQDSQQETEADDALREQLAAQRARIAKLELKSKHLVTSQFAGNYHAIFKGRGIEFDEVRPYSPGDDVRSIDWNVLARTGDAYVKRYIEERELTVMLVVDVSGSQDIGSRGRSKRELAAELAALIAFVANNNHDNIGLISFGQDVVTKLPARKGRKHVRRIIHEVLTARDLLAATNTSTTNVSAAFDSLNTLVKQRSIVFVISDFLVDISGLESNLKRASQRHEVIALRLTDPLDTNLADVGLIALEDAETGELLWLDSHQHLDVNAHQDAVTRLFRKYGIDHVGVQPSDDAFGHLHHLFEARNTRRHQFVRGQAGRGL
ncbi:MAG: DUF58 domain-containing protein, partial [Deinococcota bacterium]